MVLLLLEEMLLVCGQTMWVVESISIIRHPQLQIVSLSIIGQVMVLEFFAELLLLTLLIVLLLITNLIKMVEEFFVRLILLLILPTVGFLVINR